MNKYLRHLKETDIWYKEASLTVEAALVMPLFLYFMIAFLFFIQIFTVQEKIQSNITKMGLNLSKTAYFYKDFPDIEEALNFDKAMFGNEFDIGLNEITDKIISGYSLGLYAKGYLDKDFISNSCIKNGFDGIDFFYSSVKNEDNCIDIVLKYKIHIPIKIFIITDLEMLQRVKVRAWTGYEVAAAYQTLEKKNENSEDTIVYITETGSVYHKTSECSHIKLSVTEIQGIPSTLRNDSGAKYYKCEACCNGKEGEAASYYITSDGTRYHTIRNCSKIKRTVKEIKLSEVGSRAPCSRCYK